MDKHFCWAETIPCLKSKQLLKHPPKTEVMLVFLECGLQVVQFSSSPGRYTPQNLPWSLHAAARLMGPQAEPSCQATFSKIQRSQIYFWAKDHLWTAVAPLRLQCTLGLGSPTALQGMLRPWKYQNQLKKTENWSWFSPPLQLHGSWRQLLEMWSLAAEILST